jgi:hypothetical protein
MVVGDNARLQICGACNGYQVWCGLRYILLSTTSYPDLPNAIDLAATWDSTISPLWLACCSTDYECRGYRVQYPEYFESAPGYGYSAYGHVGTGPGAANLTAVGGKLLLCYNKQGLFHHHTAPVMMPPAPDGWTDGNAPLPAYASALAALAAALNNPIVGTYSTWKLQVGKTISIGEQNNPICIASARLCARRSRQRN